MVWSEFIPDISKATTPREVEIYDAAIKRLYLINWKIMPSELDNISPKLLKIWGKLNSEEFKKKQLKT